MTMTRPTFCSTPSRPVHSGTARITTRREFLGRAATIAGAAALSPALLMAADTPAVRTAVDQVPLGKTGLKLSRLGFGTGTNSGHVQHALGKEAFSGLIRYAFERGITFFDTAETYQTFPWIADATKGLPREKIFLQSKVSGEAKDVLKVIDHHRDVFKTDYMDSLLIHCMLTGEWTDQRKREMDAFEEAKNKKWIRAQGVSCHSLPALHAAAASEWVQVNLVRINPQARYIDGPEPRWPASGNNVAPVIEQIKTMHAKGHGVIGMKILGNDGFKSPDDREKSIRFAMSHPEIDAVVIGFKSRQEVDEGIERINRALAG
jgi:1-deoxyxylulose-5-phosphate synthase